MKKILVFLAMASVLAVSCKKNDPVVNAVVTVKTNAVDNRCYFQLDDSTAVLPTNYSTNPYGTEVRAYTYYTDKGEISAPFATKSKTWRSAEVVGLSKILTKKPVDSATGIFPIEILRSWVNCIEDGYVTLRFVGPWGQSGLVHKINLERTSDPLVFNLKHDGGTDFGYMFNVRGTVAFDLHDMKVPASGEYDVVINYTGYNEVAKKIKFHCKDGKYSAPVSLIEDIEAVENEIYE